MITLVDYGLGNILAFANVYKRLNIPVSVARTPSDLAGAEGIILPGVGAFDHAMERLNQSGLRETLEQKVLEERIPVLGVCVGMQMLGRSSEEGRLPGLGWIKGTVKRFQINEPGYPLPHMGWNDVEPHPRCPLFADFKEQARFYFLHSYYMECDDPGDVAATSSYGIRFASAVATGNIHGAQFHPEKSHHCGTQLLKNFAGLRSC